MQNSWVPAAVVAAVALSAFAFSAVDVRRASGEVANVSGWQSYCPLPDSRHTWSTDRAEPYSVEMLSGPKNAAPGSSYLFASEAGLRHKDLATQRQWGLDGAEIAPINCPGFSANGFTFGLTGAREVQACKEGRCYSIPIESTTWVYAYAERNNGVIALTNYGDALLFKDQQWCRMNKTGETFRCISGEQPAMLTEPRKQQFYASLALPEMTIVGEWPTGRLFLFDGDQLAPWENSPPFTSEEKVGYEAQSLALYCGDLFVGYWPRGDIWRLDGETRRWSLFARLFSQPDDGDVPLIPLLDRLRDGFNQAYFGQRITALVPYGDSLYVSTSNLAMWDEGAPTPMLNDAQRAEYGRLYRIHRSGCVSS